MKPSTYGERAGRCVGRRLRLPVAFLVGVALLGCVLATLSACGDDDIELPGNIPLPTAAPSKTPES